MPRKINYQLVFAIIILSAAVSAIGWDAWNIGSSAAILETTAVKPATKNLMAPQAKLEIVAGLLRGRQYGQWPLVAVPLSEDRGNPFAPQK